MCSIYDNNNNIIVVVVVELTTIRPHITHGGFPQCTYYIRPVREGKRNFGLVIDHRFVVNAPPFLNVSTYYFYYGFETCVHRTQRRVTYGYDIIVLRIKGYLSRFVGIFFFPSAAAVAVSVRARNKCARRGQSIRNDFTPRAHRSPLKPTFVRTTRVISHSIMYFKSKICYTYTRYIPGTYNAYGIVRLVIILGPHWLLFSALFSHHIIFCSLNCS